MGWVNWSRKSNEGPADRGPLGIDLNAGRARAAHGRASRNKLFSLAEPGGDLVLAISMEKRVAEFGNAAVAIQRRFPHAVCSNFLPFLKQPQEWKNGRHAFTAEPATAMFIEALKVATAGHDGVSFGLPPYLSVPQVTALSNLAERLKFKVRGTATAPLALAAERATHYLYGPREESGEPTRSSSRAIATTAVLVIDADEHAMTATVVRISEEEVRSLATAAFPRLGVRIWKERLLDALSDRCVRICRRDPRDAADTEQMLFDQLDESIERARTGQRVSISVRSTHWYQDLIHAPADMATFCAPLGRIATEEVRNLLATLNEIGVPRAAWLTHDAGRLPGLASAIHAAMGEQNAVRVLHPEATAAAIANLTDRWTAGELPRTHLDTAIALPFRENVKNAPNPPASSRSHPSVKR